MGTERLREIPKKVMVNTGRFLSEGLANTALVIACSGLILSAWFAQRERQAADKEIASTTSMH